MLLQPLQRTKLDDGADEAFYEFPRFVTHVDEGFIQQLTDLYRQQLNASMTVLDLMSSWVSHLPEEMEFARVEGHGLNGEELAKNPRLADYFVQDLNGTPTLPRPDCSFDAVLIAVSVQYLQYPEAVFGEIHRVLKPGGTAIVSFSNRMFYQKAIQVWRDGSEASRVALVKRYFNETAGFGTPEVIQQPGMALPGIAQLLGFQGSDPFYAVMARRLPESEAA